MSDIVVSIYRYNFTVKYIKGKDNEQADHLSHYPIWCQEQEDYGPWITDDFGKKIPVEAHISTVQSVNKYEERLHEDPLLDHMHDQGALDTQYTSVIQVNRDKQTKACVLATSDNPCRDYVSVWDRLGTLDNRDSTLLTLDIKRFVIPLQARKKILLAFIERRLSAANTVMHNLQGAESKDSYKPKHRPDHTNHKSLTLQISRPQYVLLEGQQLPLGCGSDVRLHLRGTTPQISQMQNGHREVPPPRTDLRLPQGGEVR